jgi:hypothetical protein
MNPMTSQEWWRAVLSRNGLSAPDGRPIYRYGITPEELAAARATLRWNASVINNGLPAAHLSALFICYCAEYFKLESDRGVRTWLPLTTPIGVTLPANNRDRIIEPGLQFLKRKLVKRSGEYRIRREWLLTVALQAGLPVKLLVHSEGHWLQDYLSAVLVSAFQRASLSHSEALDIAEAEQDRLRDSYKDPDFFELTADLAMALKQLRDRAPSQIVASGALHEWLDKSVPKWRDELPMHLGDEAVRNALTGLVRDANSEAITRPSAGKLSIQREIHFDGATWAPAIRLEVGGSIRLQGAKPEMGRLELVAEKAAARHIGPALAIILPPAARTEEWVLKSTLRDPLIRNFPLETPVWLEARGPALSASQPIPTQQGDGLYGEVLVFEPLGERNTCTKAVYLGSGTTASRSDTLIALVPKGSNIQAVADAKEPFYAYRGSLGDRFDVIELSSSVYVTAANSETIYRLDPGTDGIKRKLCLTACRTRGWEPLNKSVLVADTLASLRIMEGGKRSLPKSGEIEWRADGIGTWQCILASPPPIGRFRLRWRDPKLPETLDSMSVCLIPPDMRIDARHDGTHIRITLKNAEGLTIKPEGTSVRRSGADWEVKAGLCTRIRGILEVGRQQLEIITSVLPAQNMFVDTAGSAIGSNVYRLWELAGSEAVAASPRERVVIRLVNEAVSERLEEIVEFPPPPETQTIPFARLEEVMERLWSANGSLDSEIHLSFGNQSEPRVRVRLFGEPLSVEGEAIIYDQAEAARHDRRLAFRSLLEPDRELTGLDCKGLSLNGNPAVFHPPDLAYPALVYERSEGRVLTRPRLLDGPALSNSDSALKDALMISNTRERQERLLMWFKDQDLGEAGTLIASITTSLNGLPAISLDFLKVAPADALIAALLWSKDAPTEAAVWSLERQLSFSWLLCRVEAWRSAILAFGSSLMKQLTAVFDQSQAAEYAMKSVRIKLDGLVQREPCLAFVFREISEIRGLTQTCPTIPAQEAWGQMQDALHRAEPDDASTTKFENARDLMSRGVQYIIGASEPLPVGDRIKLHHLRQRHPREFEQYFGALLAQHTEAKHAKRS